MGVETFRNSPEDDVEAGSDISLAGANNNNGIGVAANTNSLTMGHGLQH